MRKSALIASLIFAVAVAALAATQQVVVLNVQKMNCPGCTLTIKKVLEKVNGVTGVEIDYKNKTATVHYDAGSTTAEVLAQAVTDSGYPASVRK